MIVYRTQEETRKPGECLSRLALLLRRFEQSGFSEHAIVVELLIEAGELEAGVADALCPDEDSEPPILHSLRRLSLSVGHLFYGSWRRRAGECARWVDGLHQAIDEFVAFSLPASIRVTVPEGYALYGLTPETYLEAASKFFAEVHPNRAVCIGLRSIGTSLSAAVGATLEALGCDVRAHTVRPHGHPFDRRLVLSRGLEEGLSRERESHFLVIDEGPGLSGSSLCGVAKRLSELGIADERIVFFPSCVPDGSGFVSDVARERWGRHRKFTASFEEVWIQSGRFAESFPCKHLQDISAGLWRSLFFNSEASMPAAHPHHERRKFLCSESPLPMPLPMVNPGAVTSDLPARASGTLLLKFIGLGRYGRAIHERASRLADAGFAPVVCGLEHGFLLMPFIPGQPMSKKEMSAGFIETVAGYLAHLKREFPAEPSVTRHEMIEMIRLNIAEGLGEEWLSRLDRLSVLRTSSDGDEAVALDGRMLPHEWLRTRGVTLKTDGCDHHADHFFPGCADIAWDIAGCCVECALDPFLEKQLIDRYTALAGDTNLHDRLRFYRLAYLAARLGYATLATGALGSTPDGKKFLHLTDHYASMLRHELTLRPA